MPETFTQFLVERSTTSASGPFTTLATITDKTTTTGPFTVPAAGTSTVVDVENSDWVVADDWVNIPGAGLFRVDGTPPDSTLMRVIYADVPTNLSAGVSIKTGEQVLPGSYRTEAPTTGKTWDRITCTTSSQEFAYNTVSMDAVGSDYHQIGYYRLTSTHADSNSNGDTAFLVNDTDLAYVIIYDRFGHFKKYDTGLYYRDIYTAAELTIIDDRIIIVYVSLTNEPMFHVVIKEYIVAGNALQIVQTITHDRFDHRYIHIYKTVNDTVVVSVGQNNQGIVTYIFHRTPDGVWHDDGLIEIVPPPSEAPGLMGVRMAENPTDDSLWLFGIKDSWGTLNGARVSFNPLCQLEERIQILRHEMINSEYPDGLMTMHGEFPIYFKAITDRANDRILFLYQNEQRLSLPDPPDYATDLAKLSLTEWNPLRDLKALVYMTPGYTERVGANYTLNVIGATHIIRYVPQTKPTSQTTTLPLILAENSNQEALIFNISSVCMHRTFNDFIFVRNDGNVFVAIK